ncbi:MAG: AAA family ATPase [Patescibacteria group bacterium]|nr:AAA family ATPase [Patescibacteria group bacterium]
MALDGPSGAGKTYTALRLAFSIAPNRRVAVIGTEGSETDDAAEKYINEPDPDHPGEKWQFDILHLSSFSPSEYSSAIEEAGRRGYEIVIVDSLSHAWEGKDGALELKDRKGGNQFTAWKDITPMHRRMIDSILNSPCHVIATMRSKTEYVMEKDANGKDVPRKIGMAPIQRQGMEYEFDIYGSLDWSHIMTVTKSRCRTVDGMIVSKPGAGFMQPVIEWLSTGQHEERQRPSAGPSDEQRRRFAELLDKLGWKIERAKADWPRKFGCQEWDQLTADQANAVISQLEGHGRGRVKTAKKPAMAESNGHSVQPPPAPTYSPVTEANPTIGTAAGPITDPQIKSLLSLYSLLEFGSNQQRWKDHLSAFGVSSAKNLTEKQAAKLIYDLEKEFEAKMENERQNERKEVAAAGSRQDTAASKS